MNFKTINEKIPQRLQLTISLIASIVTLFLTVLFFGLGEFSNNLRYKSTEHSGYFEECFNQVCSRNNLLTTSLVLVTFGFVLAIHSAAFSAISLYLHKRVLRDVLVKILIVVLTYNVFAVIFLIAGWYELRFVIKTDTISWSYVMLIFGYSFSLISFVPIIFSIIKSYKIRFVKDNQTNVK